MHGLQAAPGAPLSEQPTTDTPTRRPTRLWVGSALTVLIVDQLTKWWALSALTEGTAKPLVGQLLQLRLLRNAGAAFSLGTGYTIFLTCLALVIIVVGIRAARRIRSLVWATALGLLLGGALGNVSDRLFRAPGPLRGHVVDFLELPHWPVFNVADMAITCAAVLLVVQSLRGVGLDGRRDTEAGAS